MVLGSKRIFSWQTFTGSSWNSCNVLRYSFKFWSVTLIFMEGINELVGWALELEVDFILILTGHVNGNGKAIEFENPVCGVSVTGFGPNSEVITSPKVQGEVVSILTWYSLRQTLNLGRQTPSHSTFCNVFPVQHFPKSFLPASLSNDSSLNSNTPDDSACGRTPWFWLCFNFHIE